MRLLWILALVAACEGEPEAPAFSSPAAIPADLVLRDRTVTDTAEAVARATSTPIAIDASAQPYAGCARITVVAPGRPPRETVIASFEDALRGTGLRLERAPGRLTVRRDPGSPPPRGCARAGLPSLPDPGAGEVLDPWAARPLDPTPPTIPPDLANDVRAESATEIRITRAWRDRVAADDQQSLLRAARVIPHEEDGAIVGVKVYGVRRSSWLHAVGILNGDLVRSINGHRFTDPDSALDAYTRLRRADTYRVELTRRGQPLTLHIRVVDRL